MNLSTRIKTILAIIISISIVIATIIFLHRLVNLITRIDYLSNDHDNHWSRMSWVNQLIIAINLLITIITMISAINLIISYNKPFRIICLVLLITMNVINIMVWTWYYSVLIDLSVSALLNWLEWMRLIISILSSTIIIVLLLSKPKLSQSHPFS
jgi:hypothetical protein